MGLPEWEFPQTRPNFLRLLKKWTEKNPVFYKLSQQTGWVQDLENDQQCVERDVALLTSRYCCCQFDSSILILRQKINRTTNNPLNTEYYDYTSLLTLL